MKFNHCPPNDLKELSTKTVDGKRFYITPEGDYPSITTLLGHFDKHKLLEWRKRVGEEEANKISSKASSRGTKIHSLCEKYLLNEDIEKNKIDPDDLEMFYSFKPILNNINNIHYLECPLYSNRLKVAGRVDCIGEYNNKLSIIDFKTSKKLKDESYIENYFLQATFYSMAYYELTGIKVNQIAILIAVDYAKPQEFIRPIEPYMKKLVEKIRTYHQTVLDKP